MTYKIYSKTGCTHCEMAKNLLDSKGLQFEVVHLDQGLAKDPDKTYYTLVELRELIPDAKSVPQIFYGEQLIGGFNQLKKHLE